MLITCTRGATHEYHADGIDLFSVSQIRKVAHDPYVGIPESILQAARVRGLMLHRRFWRKLAAQAGLTSPPAIIDEFEGYCRSMDKWIELNQVLPVKLEEPGLSLRHGFAGTPDALVTIGPKQFKAIIDLKTGAPTLTDKMQLLAYNKMDGYDEVGFLVDVYIQADGSRAKESRVRSGDKAVEWAWFMSALGVLQSRVNHGVKS